MYDFTKASDLVKWAEEQYKSKNQYKSGGIGRYDSDGTRRFDCCGLFKCFMWHDYYTGKPGCKNNAAYYGKVQKDLSCEGLLAEAKEKGDISTIPEIPGVLVYMKGHMGIYIGNGKVIESTGKKYDGKTKKIYKTYFKGDGKGCDGKRTTWTKWFKSPYLTYDKEEKKEIEPAKEYWVAGKYEILIAKCIRKSTDLGNNIVKAKNCTPVTQNILVSTTGDAKIKVGSKITITQIIKKNNRVWGKYGNCYIVLCNQDGTPQAKKI